MRKYTLCALMLALCLIARARADELNLVANSSAEQANGEGRPASWEPLNVAAPAKFSVDDSEHHGDGARSLRIDAGEVCRSYWRCDPIPVAPGEQIAASAWVKMRDVPAAQGTVILIAEFTDARGLNQSVEKFNTARVTGTDADQQWQLVSGKVTVPDGASRLRLRMGFSYCRGILWWDDVRVTTDTPLALRVDLPNGRLTPASGAVPVTILNRAATRGEQRVRLLLGAKEITQTVQLDGSPVQTIAVAIELRARGKQRLEATLLPAHGDQPFFSTKRELIIPPALVLRPICPTHWAIEDGPATVEVAPDIAIAKRQLDRALVTVRLVNAAGNTVHEWSPPSDVKIEDGINRFEVKLPEAPLGDYTISCEVRPADGSAAIRAEQPLSVIPRLSARTTLNANGYLEHGGKAIFPLGIFNGGAKAKEMGEAGFTVNHAYNAANAEAGEIPNDQGAKDFLDRSAANGMTVLLLIPRGIAFHGDWDGFRHRIRLLKNHPALLAWDEEEGIARGDMPPEYLEKMRQIIAEEDPHHPLMVGDSRDIITRVPDRSNFFPLASMDLGMWWWYPIPLPQHATTGNALEGDEGTGTSELSPPAFLVKRNTDKPIWVGVQSYKKRNGRYPNPTEYRAQAYIALIHGAKGLMWYGGSVQGGIYLAPEEGHWDELKSLVRELNGLQDVFMSADGTTPAFEPKEAPISVVLKRTPTRTVLLVANRGGASVDAKFTLDRITDTAADVVSENRTCAVRDGRLSDHFEPYQVHVYELKSR
jgi:hypothetical protein